MTDPTLNEEELSDSMIRIAVDPDMDSDVSSDCILFLEITGTQEIDDELLMQCYSKACKRGKFLRKLIDQQTKDGQNQTVRFDSMS